MSWGSHTPNQMRLPMCATSTATTVGVFKVFIIYISSRKNRKKEEYIHNFPKPGSLNFFFLFFFLPIKSMPIHCM